MLFLVVPREIRRDLRPALAAVLGPEEDVARVVDHACAVGGPHDRVVPVEAELVIDRVHAEIQLGVSADRFALAALAIPDIDFSLDAGAVDVTRLLRIVERQVGALAARDVVEVLPADPAGRGARDADRRVVLLAAVDVVRELVVGDHAVELRRRLVLLRRPARAAVEADVRAAVVRVDHHVVVGRVDPQVVIVAMRNAHGRERAPSVDRAHERSIEHDDRVLVLRIGKDLHVVPGASLDRAVLAQVLPAAAAVVGTIEPALAVLRLDDRVDAVGVGAGDVDPDLPHGLRQTAAEPRPGVTAVLRLPDPAVAAP